MTKQEIEKLAESRLPHNYVILGWGKEFTVPTEYMRFEGIIYEHGRRCWEKFSLLTGDTSKFLYAIKKDSPIAKLNIKMNKVLEIQIKKMFDYTVQNSWDIVQCNKQDEPDYSGGIELEMITALIRKDVKILRELFQDGLTYYLIPDFNEEIEEIRIYDEDKLLTVLVGDEIQY